jgi:serine protease Do
MDAANQLRDKGHVSRGWLGVLTQDVPYELADLSGMTRPEGALIVDVLPDSPAEYARLAVGDIVLALDNTPVMRSLDVPLIVSKSAIGSHVSVDILREGRSHALHVTIRQLSMEFEF